ncbi:MAG: ABC-type transport auxiliary lipoprotein family protein [Rhodobacteraceae bacterium]|nr:ABC-type transport auxiliary lipoprotein family protein [Paracoccaceae bacterium]
MTYLPARQAVLALGLALGLGGCAGLQSLTAVTQPTDLYLLSPKSTFDQRLPRLSDQLVIMEPTATAAVDTDRIAVQPTPLRVQYLPAARWVDRAPVIIQALLIESFENSGKVGAVGSSAVGLRADYTIVTDVREFQALVRPATADLPERLEIIVRLNVKLVFSDVDRIIGSASFERRVFATSEAAPDVVEAFDKALGGTMREAVEWSVRTISRYAADNAGPGF